MAGMILGFRHRLVLATSVDTAILGIMVLAAILGTLVWLVLIRFATTPVVYISIVVWLGLAIYATVLCFLYGQIGQGVAMCIVVPAAIVFIFLWRDRIPLAIVFIKEGAKGIFNNAALALVVVPSVTFAGIVGMALLSWGWTLVFRVHTPVIAIFALFSVFCTFWWLEAVRSVKTIAVSHCVATWYVVRRSRTGERASAFTGLGLALTKHAGSALFGSLILATLRTMRALADFAQSRGGNNGNGGALVLILQLIGCCMVCILSLIEAWVQYVNRYAMIYVAIHGDDFCTSCSKAFRLFERSGCQNFMNDILVGMSVFTATVLITASSVGFALIVCPAMGLVVHHSPTLLIGGGLAATTAVVYGGMLTTSIDTLYVAYMEDIERNAQYGQPLNCSKEWHGAVQNHPSVPDKIKSVPMPPMMENEDHDRSEYVAVETVHVMPVESGQWLKPPV